VEARGDARPLSLSSPVSYEVSLAVMREKDVADYIVWSSLVGLRAIALEKGAEVDAMDVEDVEDMLADCDDDSRTSLAAYPAQCNATGSRLGLELGRRIKKRSPGTAVLLDAAAYLSNSVLDLDSLPIDEAPDFVACSFYKLFVSIIFISGRTRP
jgi:selenocysteine lyase/cysteine desulfurase